MNKKGASQLFWIIMVAAIAITAGILIIVWFSTSGGKAFRSVDTQLGALDDYDDDRVANGFDKCPCTAVGTEEQTGLRGCPKGTTAEQAKINQQKFKENKCSEVTTTITQPKLFYLEISPTLTQDSYETTNTFLRYTFTCPPNIQCSLRIMEPGGRVRPDIQPGSPNDLELVNGEYVFDLLDESDQVLKTVTVTKK